MLSRFCFHWKHQKDFLQQAFQIFAQILFCITDLIILKPFFKSIVLFWHMHPFYAYVMLELHCIPIVQLQGQLGTLEEERWVGAMAVYWCCVLWNVPPICANIMVELICIPNLSKSEIICSTEHKRKKRWVVSAVGVYRAAGHQRLRFPAKVLRHRTATLLPVYCCTVQWQRRRIDRVLLAGDGRLLRTGGWVFEARIIWAAGRHDGA